MNMSPYKAALYGSVFLQMVVPAGAQFGAIASFAIERSVVSVVEELKKNISELTSQIDNSIGARSFQLRSELAFLSSELEYRSLRVADKTFGNITKQQQAFFDGTRRSLTDLRETLDKGQSDVDELLSKSEDILSQVPFIGEEPRLRKVSPLYIQSFDEGEGRPVQVSFDGSYLNHGEATLQLGDKKCDRVSFNERHLDFTCPASLFSTEDSVKLVSGMLEVEDDPSSWESFKKLFGYYKPRKQYGVSVNVIPKRIGDYSLEIGYTSNDVISNGRSGDWGFTNDHCTGRTSRTYNFGPQAPGWEIDVGSIAISDQCLRNDGSRAIRNSSSSGFQIEAWTRNDGQCGKIGGTIISYDGRGCSSGAVQWTEKKIEPRELKETKPDEALYWGMDKSIPLPSTLNGFILTVKQIDGRLVVINSANSSKWFDVERDAAGTSLILHPKSLTDAMKAE